MKKPDAMPPAETSVRTSAQSDDVVDRWFAEFRVGLDSNTHNHFRAAVEDLKERLRAAQPKE